MGSKSAEVIKINFKPDLVSRSPMAFLLGSGVLSNICDHNPLVSLDRHGEFKQIERITERNLYEKSVAYMSWMRGTVPAMQRYLQFDVMNMWNAFNGEKLTQEYALDPLLKMNGFLERTVDGFEYRLAQMTPALEIGYGWRVADWMVVPTGGADMSRIKFPDFVRGCSPLMFYHPGLDNAGWALRAELTDDYARGLFGLKRDTQTEYGRVGGREVSISGGNGDEGATRRTISSIIGSGYGPEHMENDWESMYRGATIKTNGTLVCELLNSARRKFVPVVDRVAITAKKVGDEFWGDFSRRNDKFDPATLELFSQLVMSGWAGTQLAYFERYYNRPVAEYVKRK